MSKQRSKISTFFASLYPGKTFFGSYVFHAKPTDKKQSNADRLGFASIRAEPLGSFVLGMILTRYNATYKTVGIRPHTTSQHSCQKAKGRTRERDRQTKQKITMNKDAWRVDITSYYR
ncbi:hypothetical protein [Bacillus wiedmannii]|uniref:hypothetical protein n=1 Tax=Bacillus wiedmannii TaxID=1890302 RepID=UPI0016801F97|nr:hypothetical protein [Bacillus wiedmannii]